jgi:putative glutamine amidotransferase
MNPLVALTTGVDPEGGDHRRPRVALYTAYLEVLKRVGLTAVLVTPAHGPDDVAALMENAAGLILTGGGDIASELYGEEPTADLLEVDPDRDTMEMRALELALERGLPILGVCRGMQVLNVYFGGTLYQDLPSQYGDATDHEQSGPWGEHQHEVRLTDGSLLHGILGVFEPLRTNSYHHQAVKDLGAGLTCTARSEDGLIEGIEATGHDWVVGVQWHPERKADGTLDADPESDPDLRLLDAFARQVRAGQD